MLGLPAFPSRPSSTCKSTNEWLSSPPSSTSYRRYEPIMKYICMLLLDIRLTYIFTSFNLQHSTGHCPLSPRILAKAPGFQPPIKHTIFAAQGSRWPPFLFEGQDGSLFFLTAKMVSLIALITRIRYCCSFSWSMSQYFRGKPTLHLPHISTAAWAVVKMVIGATIWN